jgi:hypothetical protein
MIMNADQGIPPEINLDEKVPFLIDSDRRLTESGGRSLLGRLLSCTQIPSQDFLRNKPIHQPGGGKNLPGDLPEIVRLAAGPFPRCGNHLSQLLELGNRSRSTH